MSSVAFADAQRAKQHLAAIFDGAEIVAGIGIAPTDDGFVIKLNLTHEPLDIPLPDEVDGVSVEIEVTGSGFPQALGN